VIDAAEFRAKTGREPGFDDLERSNCKEAGTIGHFSCGWCATHSKPVFECPVECRVPPRPA